MLTNTEPTRDPPRDPFRNPLWDPTRNSFQDPNRGPTHDPPRDPTGRFQGPYSGPFPWALGPYSGPYSGLFPKPYSGPSSEPFTSPYSRLFPGPYSGPYSRPSSEPYRTLPRTLFGTLPVTLGTLILTLLGFRVGFITPTRSLGYFAFCVKLIIFKNIAHIQVNQDHLFIYLFCTYFVPFLEYITFHWTLDLIAKYTARNYEYFSLHTHRKFNIIICRP